MVKFSDIKYCNKCDSKMITGWAKVESEAFCHNCNRYETFYIKR